MPAWPVLCDICVYKAAINYELGYGAKLTDHTGKPLKDTNFVSKK